VYNTLILIYKMNIKGGEITMSHILSLIYSFIGLNKRLNIRYDLIHEKR
jgi:hypothetical protein